MQWFYRWNKYFILNNLALLMQQTTYSAKYLPVFCDTIDVLWLALAILEWYRYSTYSGNSKISVGISSTKNLNHHDSWDGKSISKATTCMKYTSKMEKDSIVVPSSSLNEPMKSRASILLNANGMSTRVLRKLSAGLSWDRSPSKSLSLSSSSDVGAIFSKVWRNSGGSSCPVQPKWICKVFHTSAEQSN